MITNIGASHHFFRTRRYAHISGNNPRLRWGGGGLFVTVSAIAAIELAALELSDITVLVIQLFIGITNCFAFLGDTRGALHAVIGIFAGAAFGFTAFGQALVTFVGGVAPLSRTLTVLLQNVAGDRVRCTGTATA